MMEKDKLRKTDIFSGSLIVILGIWIITQSLKMPMKDSWGGVQNVWFVSPAIFPLFVGAVIVALGGALIRTALKQVGWNGLVQVMRWLGSPALIGFVKTGTSMRFVAMVVLLGSLVYLNIPRIDFFLCAVLFLSVFITMFYFDDDELLRRMLLFYVVGTLLLAGYFVLGLDAMLEPQVPYLRDWLMLIFIIAYGAWTWRIARRAPGLRKKYKTSYFLAVSAPFIIGPIFKYLLLVPMPTEGLVVVVMDAIRYWDF